MLVADTPQKKSSLAAGRVDDTIHMSRITVETVSYFGDSYCKIQAVQDVSTFQLSLQLKTSRRSGLLLLAAGMEDYMFLELHNGKLQVRMNMGAGEVTLSSNPGVQLNNLLEHHVSVTLLDSKLTMMIDELFSTNVPVPGADEEELNIDHGVWLGGTGDLVAPFLSNAIPPFRGCIANVKFQSHGFDILNSELKDCHDTKESCSSEFEAGDGEATSFISPDSFISLPTWSGASGAGRALEFLMKTTIEDAVLVFHPGRESDFIAVGVVGGFLKGVVDLGKGMQVVDNIRVKLDDDQWHRVRLEVEMTSFKMNVDSMGSSLPLDGSQSLDLVGNLYLGGIQTKMKDVFHDSGILDRMEEQITSESFIGCFGEIKVNQKHRSLQDALVTKDVHVKCEGEDYDYSSYYDAEATTTAAPVRIRYVDADPSERDCYPTEGMPEAFRNITKLLDPPTLGSLLFRGSELSEGDTFTEQDIRNDDLSYVHSVHSAVESVDQFQFRVITIQSKNEHMPVRVVDKGFNVVRNGQRLLTTNVLQFRDDDANFNDTQIVYAHEGILSGQLVLASNPSQPIFRFTQADLRDKRILFKHHGADRDHFQLQVSDGLHQATTLMQLQAGEPYLRVENNTMVVMDHGSSKTIDTALLSADSNMDVRDDGNIIFEVTSPPGDGRIIVSGIEALKFTQEDLKKGVVSYEHNYESLRSKDSFGFTVQCKGHSQEGTFRIKIFKQGYLSEPEVVTNEVLIAYEGEHTVIDQDHLKVEQSDILPSEMVFTIKESPRLGHVVMLVNHSDRADTPVLDYIHTFTQDDVDEGRVLYVSASKQGSDVFRTDVSNGFTTVENLEVTVSIVPRLIPLLGHNFTVKEGLGASITTEILNISHPFYNDANIDFLVEEPPRHGDLRYRDGTVQELAYFTWEEVKLGHIFYMHDSSETTEDSFTLSASVRLVLVLVVPVLAGEESDITSSMLSTQDADTPLTELVYRVDALPTGGMVALKEAPDQGIWNFTQAQINNGEVIFTHQGEESGGFSFKVTDGEHTSPLYHFTVTARPLTITMETQEDLMVFPGTRQPITSANLGAVTNEDGNEISYSLLRPPRLGRLILANDRNQYEEITEFTQTQLQSGLVFYEHQLPEEPFWVLRDAVELLLSSQPASDIQHVLPITVSYYTAHPNASSQLWKNKGLDVVQGQGKVIDSSVLDASNLLASVPEAERGRLDVVYEIKRFPAHGRLTLAGVDVPRSSPVFMQRDVAAGSLEYVPGDSGASSDNFSFRAYLNLPPQEVTSSTQSVVLEEELNISIRRRDSNPPELVSTDTFLEVLRGSLTVVTQKHLNARDEDSRPDEVRYEVTRAPGNGRLVDTLSMKPVSEFTQEMVNRGRVGFVSDGSLADGFAEFVLSDGRHRTEPHTLRVGVLERTLLLAKALEIRVRQGDDETPLTEDILKASAVGPVDEDVVYTITGTPKYAAVMVDRLPTSAFTQTQIREGRVSVRFIKSTSPRDSVAFVASVGPGGGANVSSVLNITVEPLANIARDPVLPRGTLVRLDRALLDASPLENKTQASAVFSVVQQPRRARLVRSGGPGAGQPVDSFTQQDLDRGLVAMEISDGPAEAAGPGDDVSRDEARFLLAAHGVPPAECTLSFRTEPYNASGLYPVTLLRVPPQFPWVDANDPPPATTAAPRLRPDVDMSRGNPGVTTLGPGKDTQQKPV
ncbi:hypothetical protein NHX12_002373, partial [Muraenolepis orangiensis]